MRFYERIFIGLFVAEEIAMLLLSVGLCYELETQWEEELEEKDDKMQ